LIESVLSKPSRNYGTEVCTICGRLQTFHGWAAAMARHRFDRFACWECVREVRDDEARRLLCGKVAGRR
jgi:hypothetical protein